MTGSAVSVEDWIKGIALSVLASVIGGASKLAIRKSWLLELHGNDDESNNVGHVLSNDVTSTATDVFADVDISEEEWRKIEPAREEGAFYQKMQEDVVSHQENHSINTNGESSNGNPSSLLSLSTKTKALAYSLRFGGMMGMTFLNPLCCVLAMNYASPSILAPFSGLTLVWIVLLSNPLINEKPTRRQVLAATLIVVGEVIVAIFGDHTNDNGVTVKEVEDSYREPLFLAYFVAIAIWMVALGFEMKYGQSLLLRRFAWGVSGGSITGLQNFLKDSLTILKAVHAKQESNSNIGLSLPWHFYFMMFLAMTTAFIGLLLLTACMKRYDATYSSAMFVGSFVVSASIMSVTHYKTFSNLEHIYNFVLYPLGLAILMLGVVILVYETKGENSDGDGNADDISMSSEALPSVTVVPSQRGESDPLLRTAPGSEGDVAW